MNLSLKTDKKATRKLPETGLKKYKKFLVSDVEIKENYSFILPTMARNKENDFFVLQCKEGCLAITDWYYILHYGIRNDIKDFKVFLHHTFYGKIVTIVIFKYNEQTEYGILYDDYIYYCYDSIYYSNIFLGINEILTGNNFNKYYKMNEIKLQDVYVDTYESEEKKLNVDLNKMYYVNTLWNDEDGQRYVRINEYNIDFFKEFWINEFKSVAIAEIKINHNEDDVEKYKSNIDKFFIELKKRDKKMNVNNYFDEQYKNFRFINYITNFEPSILSLSHDSITELKEYFEISKIKNYNSMN